MTPADSARIERALEDAERRERRDAYRAAGGSRRRALRTFYTDAEKREVRAEHRSRIAAALESLESADGMRAYLLARALNPELTPLTQALAADSAPGKIVGNLRYWNRHGGRIAKGERAVAYGTKAPAFWPDPLFTAEQAGAVELVEGVRPALPAGEVIAELAAEVRGRFAEHGRKTKTLNIWAEELAERELGPVEEVAEELGDVTTTAEALPF